MNETGPRYYASVSYFPCPNCGEGTLEYDTEIDQSRCPACETVYD